jgi:hypothetical protein
MRAATLNGFLIISTLVMSSLSANAAGPETQNGRSCPENDAAVVILSKKPYCTAHHLSGHKCQARWEEYFVETNRNNKFLAECRMQHSSGAGSTSGTAATASATPGSVTPGTLPSTAPTGDATPGTVTPGIGGTALPLPSTTPTQRATTGVMENQQTLDRPQDQPSTTPPNPVTTNPSDMGTGGAVTTSPGGSGGTDTGRPTHVKDTTDISNRVTAVIGPGQLSYPAALERKLSKTP